MEVIKQPDLQVFASSAKSGEVLKFPDILRGWGVTLDQTQGKPPLEWMNDAFKRIDLNILYQLQQGIPTWNKSVRYPKDAVVKNDGKIYMCLVENENNDPNLSSDKWSLLIKKATTAQTGITQLTSALSDREDLSATPKMVNDVNRAAKAAQTAANQANDKANTAQSRADSAYSLGNTANGNANTRLEKSKNLSDLTNATTARNNLGLGSSATLSTTSTLSDRTDQVATIKVVNDVNRDASTAQKTADKAHALAQSKQDKLTFVGGGLDVMKVGAYGLGGYAYAIDGDNTNPELIEKPQMICGFTRHDNAVKYGYPLAIRVSDGTRDVVFYAGVNKNANRVGVIRSDKEGFTDTILLTESDVTNSLGSSKKLVASQALVNSVAQKIDDVPVDQIFAFEIATPPKGYIARNGQSINKDTMPKLYARYGAKMPDDRDRALRMSGGLAGTVGSAQEDAIQNIIGDFYAYKFGDHGTSGAFIQTWQGSSNLAGSGGTVINHMNVKLDASRVVRTASETRVKSRIVIFCNKIQ